MIAGKGISRMLGCSMRVPMSGFVLHFTYDFTRKCKLAVQAKTTAIAQNDLKEY